MILFLLCSCLSEQAESLDITGHYTTTIDFTEDQTTFTGKLSLSESYVIIHTLDGFSVTAYDEYDKEIGSFSENTRIFSIGSNGGKFIATKTGTNNQFSFSVFVKGNLQLENQCKNVIVSNNANFEYSLSEDLLNSNEPQCIWLASPSKMSVSLSAEISGEIEAYGPGSYTVIAKLEEGQKEINFESANTIISFVGKGTSSSLSFKSTGEDLSYVEKIEGSFKPNDTEDGIELSPLPSPGPTPDPTTTTEQSTTTTTEQSTTTTMTEQPTTTTEQSTTTTTEQPTTTTTEQSTTTTTEQSTTTTTTEQSEITQTTEQSTTTTTTEQPTTTTEQSTTTTTEQSTTTTTEQPTTTTTEQSTTTTTTEQSEITQTTNDQGSGDADPEMTNKEKIYVISIAVISSIAFIAILLAIIFFIKLRKQRTVDGSDLIRANLV